MANNQGTAGIVVNLNGTDVPDVATAAVTVEMDINQPDLCTATLNNAPKDGYSKNTKMGDTLTCTVGATDGATQELFTGEIVGIEAVWDVKGESKVIFRALNKLHRMGHEKKSVSYQNMTDQDMANKVAQEFGLTLQAGTLETDKRVHIYRHHQTALEFLQDRGGRYNYEFRVSGTTLTYGRRDLSKDSGIELIFGTNAKGAYVLQKFQVRITNQNQAAKVQILGWDHVGNKPIKQEVAASPVLGTKGGHQHAADGLGTAPTHVDSDVPVSDTNEAKAIATAKMAEMALNFLKAEAVCKGNPALKPSLVVTVKPQDGQSEPDTRFTGKYYVVSAMHRYSHQDSGADGGYTTLLKLKRDGTSS